MRSSTSGFGRAFAASAQAIALRAGVGAVRCLDPARASDIGGFAARTIGPQLPVSRVADSNLRRALPLLTEANRGQVIRGMWDNLGRTVAELPHLASFRRTSAGAGWEIQGEEHVTALREAGKQALFFSGHFGNWEMILPIAGALGLPVSGYYRASSNVAVNGLIQSLRQPALGPGVAMYPKGAAGARAGLAHLHGGGSLGLLVDQKMNDGIAVPFFGRNAMTAPALAQFALRFTIPIMPVHVVRLGPARFRMVCEAPLAVAATGNKTADVLAISLAVNVILEGWIRADPAAWLWVHRRWPKEPASGSGA
jgi:KDO2-lipid IV(A) lauroyltransferase